MKKSLSAVVQGRVQGVGFRYFVLNRAKSMGVKGWVRNLPDGTVETLGTGEGEVLERFMQELKRGPIGSRVEKVEFQWLEDPLDFQDFEIKG